MESASTALASAVPEGDSLAAADRPGGPGADPVALADAGAADCVMCSISADPAQDEEFYVVVRGRTTIAVLNIYPYTSGHLMVLPTRHVSSPELLPADEGAELWAMATRAVAALRQAYEPDGINLGANIGRAAGAGVPGHLHLHCLPRFNGDTNFMTTVAEARVLPESLDSTYRRLKASWWQVEGAQGGS
ncbi:MAG: HIT family protein [Acidimicrobiales bacterium]